MPHNLTGYKWEGAACLGSLAAAALVLYFVGVSPFPLTLVLGLIFFGVCFGISYLRTWRKVYRNVALAILLVVAVYFYLAILLPSR